MIAFLFVVFLCFLILAFVLLFLGRLRGVASSDHPSCSSSSSSHIFTNSVLLDFLGGSSFSSSVLSDCVSKFLDADAALFVSGCRLKGSI